MSLIGQADTPASYVADYMQACVGMFGIPAGAFTADIEAYGAATSWNVESLYAAMLNSSIGRSIYTPGSSNTTLATKLVDKLGGSLLSTANKAAVIDLAKSMLDGGDSLAKVCMTFVEAVSNISTTDADYGKVAQQFANRIEIANYYTFSSTSPSSSLSTLQGVLSGVSDTTNVTDPAAYLNTVTSPGVSTGQTFTLTSSTDNITGTTGNDTIIGDWTATATINGSDQIAGGDGTDTFKAYGALGTLPASMTGIENVILVNPGTLSITDTTVGLSGIKKLSIEQAGVAASTITTTSNSGLTLDLATLNNGSSSAVTWAANATDTSQTLELSGYAGATGATATAMTITGAATTTMNINTDTAANAITTLTLPTTATTVNITAATNLSVTTSLAATAAKTVNVSGAGKVTIAGSDFASAVTVDGTNNTGGVLYTAEAAGSTLTFKGGSGNDKVTFAATTLTTADVLTGGTGTDTLAINDTALTTSANLVAVNAATGFETLGLNTTGASLDMSLLTNGITNVAIGAGNISATTTNSLATSTYTIDNSASNTGTVSIGNKVGELSTAVTVDYGTATSAQTLAALTINGATNVSLVSTGTGSGGSNIITTLTNMDNSVITVTGSKDLTITNALAGTGTGSKVDATNFTGKLNVTGSGLADIIIGGSKADTINGGAGLDTITAGAGDDVITVNTASQADTMTLGDGADTVKFTGTSATMFTTSTGTSAIASITDFVCGTDKIGLVDTGTAFTGVTLTTQTIASAADLSAVWSGITAVGASTDNGNANAVLVTVSAGAAAGTYLYVNDTAGAAVSNSADLLVKMTGISGTLAATDFVFA